MHSDQEDGQLVENSGAVALSPWLYEERKKHRKSSLGVKNQTKSNPWLNALKYIKAEDYEK